MCVKIISPEVTQEFNPAQLLELQTCGAKEILVNYDPSDNRINCFLNQMERICQNGIDFDVAIKVNPNNHMMGFLLKKKFEKIKHDIDINELAKELTNFHAIADRKLGELSDMCLGKLNE